MVTLGVAPRTVTFRKVYIAEVEFVNRGVGVVNIWNDGAEQ